MDADPPSPLLALYLAKRDELKRYFTVRMRSAEAAEDLVQDMYLKVSAASSEEIGNAAAFLYRLGSNLMLDRLKSQRRSLARDTGWRAVTVSTLGGQDLADEPAADEAAAARQRLALIIEALNGLPPATRRAFRLHKLEGLTHAQTAEAMGLSRSSIEKHISAALKHLVRTLAA
ncbi:RNA polymerase sigma factor [Caulobacter sp. KR2-114]|uniref:RNA polymerase sigma factor n=1 Tax=Caulobacter sp. KR2-114 TaxID=3400912 RepID=UPI003C0C4584